MAEPQIRILVVCDDPFTQELIRICLSPRRFCLNHLSSERLLSLRQTPDLILLDLPESRPNGTIFWKKLREKMPRTPLLILHALVGPEKTRFEQKTAPEKQLALLHRGIMPEVLEKTVLQLTAGIPRRLIEENLPDRLFSAGAEDTHANRPWCKLDPAMLLSVLRLPVGKDGGDACEMIQLGFGRWLFFMGDLAGHGEKAARAMEQVRHVLQEIARSGEDNCEPHRILNAMNGFFFRSFAKPQSMTCVAAVVDFLRCRIRCQSAGHPPLAGYSPARNAFFRPGGKDVADDIPVGWEKDHVYQEEATATIEFPPDTVFFGFTDGLLDRLDHREHTPDGCIPPALLKTVRNASGAAAFPFRLHDALDKLGYRTCRDDITLAAFCKNTLAKDELHFVIRPGEGDPGGAAEEFVTLRTGDEVLGFKAGLLIHEFVTNILLHGLKQEKNLCGCTIYLHVKQEAEFLRIEVLDRGCEYDSSLLQQKDFDFFRRRNGRLSSSGRGIALIANLSSRITAVRYAGLNDTVFYLLTNTKQGESPCPPKTN